MALREDMERQGDWLFKKRSHLPLLAIPLFLLALRHSGIIEHIFGDAVGDLWESLCIFISFLGLAIRCFTVGYVPWGTSGRNTKSQFAESLNTTGMYSIARNPLYLGNFIIVLGITLFIQVWWFALIVWVGFWLYYERIIFTEEEFLRQKFGDLFLNWAKVTPLIFPRFNNWKKPALSFSWRTVIKREFSTFFSLVGSFFFLEIATNLIAKRKLQVNSSWIYFFLVGAVVYLISLLLKKKTKVFNIPGR